MTCMCQECVCRIPNESGRSICRMCRRNWHRQVRR